MAGCDSARGGPPTRGPAVAAPAAPAGAEPEVPADAPAIALFERRSAADSRDHVSPTFLAGLWIERAESRDDAAAWKAAERAARTALERLPGHAPATVALARALGGAGRAIEARAMIRGVLEGAPRDARALETAFELAVRFLQGVLIRKPASKLWYESA